MKNISKLEEQVRTASLKNRVRRRVIVGRYRLLVRAATSAAGKPAVLGMGALVGFSLGLIKSDQPASPRSNSWVGTKILSLAINYLAQTALREK